MEQHRPSHQQPGKTLLILHTELNRLVRVALASCALIGFHGAAGASLIGDEVDVIATLTSVSSGGTSPPTSTTVMIDNVLVRDPEIEFAPSLFDFQVDIRGTSIRFDFLGASGGGSGGGFGGLPGPSILYSPLLYGFSDLQYRDTAGAVIAGSITGISVSSNLINPASPFVDPFTTGFGASSVSVAFAGGFTASAGDFLEIDLAFTPSVPAPAPAPLGLLLLGLAGIGLSRLKAR